VRKGGGGGGKGGRTGGGGDGRLSRQLASLYFSYDCAE